MDNLQFIDTNTWELIDEPDSIIHVDKGIAKTIAILNKKGYKTVSSCAGHPDIELISWADKPENVKDYFNPIQVVYDKECDLSFFYKTTDSIQIYILFDKIYEFDKLPKDFKYEITTIKNNVEYDENGKKIRTYKSADNTIINRNDCAVDKEIKIIDNNKKLYDFSVILEKIEEANQDLLDWAKELKENK